MRKSFLCGCVCAPGAAWHVHKTNTNGGVIRAWWGTFLGTARILKRRGEVASPEAALEAAFNAGRLDTWLVTAPTAALVEA